MDIFYTIVEFFVAGGIFMAPIALVGAAATAIVVERYVTLTRAIVSNRRAWTQVEPAITSGDFEKAREITTKDSTPMSRLLSVGLARQGAVRRLDDVEKAMRASMLEIVNADYIKTARAKGLTRRQIVWRHQLRNALFPILTILGPAVASVLTGSFVIETIFAIPGLGRHFVTAMQNLDYTLVLGLTIFFGFFLIAMNFLVDVAYGLIDPRIRHS